MASNIDTISFEELEAMDVISVELVPERKGLILKHCEYYVSSRRHGTTVTRRYNDFAQLYDVLYAKYPYRAICRLPPKRVVVNGGSPRFLQRRRAALQRWLTLIARHPVLAHDADVRSFLCEVALKMEKPKHDEFTLAGTQEDKKEEMSMEEMQATFELEQEQLRLVQLGLGRLFQIFERAETRHEADKADVRELGAGLSALSSSSAVDGPRWTPVRDALRDAAQLATQTDPGSSDIESAEEGPVGLVLLALDALEGVRALAARLSRGLHAERAAAAARAAYSPHACTLRSRHRYANKTQLEEVRVGRAYGLAGLQCLPELFRTVGDWHAQQAAIWADLNRVLAPTNA